MNESTSTGLAFFFVEINYYYYYYIIGNTEKPETFQAVYLQKMPSLERFF